MKYENYNFNHQQLDAQLQFQQLLDYDHSPRGGFFSHTVSADHGSFLRSIGQAVKPGDNATFENTQEERELDIQPVPEENDEEPGTFEMKPF